ncbi:hypothetical protein EMIT0P291_20099 [Pseudomonas sp. IT-P291]
MKNRQTHYHHGTCGSELARDGALKDTLLKAETQTNRGLLQDLSKVFIKSTAIWTKRPRLKSATPTRQPD